MIKEKKGEISIDKNDMEKEESDLGILQGMRQAMVELVRNPVTRYNTIGSMCSFMLNVAADSYFPAYILGAYPQFS